MWTAIRVEWAKLRPGWLVLGAMGLPAFIQLVKTLGFYQKQAALMTEGRWHWHAYFQATSNQWYLLLLPLLTASFAAYCCALETESQTWRAMLCQPVPRWQLWLAKWCAGMACLGLLAVSQALTHGLGGWVLGLEGSAGWQSLAIAVLLPLGQAPVLALHLALAARSRHVLVPVGAALLGILLALMVDWPPIAQGLPYRYGALPMLAMAPGDVLTKGLLGAIAITGVVAVVAVIDFSRRDWRS